METNILKIRVQRPVPVNPTRFIDLFSTNIEVSDSFTGYSVIVNGLRVLFPYDDLIINFILV